MKRKLFAALSFLLILTFIIPTLVSCSNNSDVQTSENSNTPDSDVQTSVEDTLNMDVNYEGLSFNVLVTSKAKRAPVDFVYNDITTSVMDQAIFDRNSIMLDEYGVNIECVSDLGDKNKGYQTILSEHTSEDNTYQMCVLSGYDAAELTLDGALFDIKALPNINTLNTWWDQAAERDLSISGSLYFTHGALSTVMDDFTYCVVFNKALYKATVGNEIDVYELVKQNKWTLDQMSTLAKSVKDDINGDQTMDSRDRYGLMIWDNELIAEVNAAGERIATIKDNGTVELTVHNETINTVIDKFVTIGNSDYCINFQHMSNHVAWFNMFTSDQVLFLMSMFNEVSRFRDMRTDYGILPNPKLSEEKEYYCPVSPWHSAFICVPLTIKDEDTVSNIIELMGYHSEKIITPAYYDKTLIGKYIRDNESIDMLDLIFANRVYDVGHLYRIASLQEHLTNLLRNNNPGGLSSTYQAHLDTANADIKELNLQILILQNK